MEIFAITAKEKVMIPKIIHYCWFGGKEKPDSVILMFIRMITAMRLTVQSAGPLLQIMHDLLYFISLAGSIWTPM